MAIKERPSKQLRVLPSAPKAPDAAETTIYRPFFLAGILSVLTAGCTLGAIALLGIALQQSYTASVWTPYVLAHANSQLYGWVGFFIMGFSLQHHRPRVEKAKLFHQLAYASLGLMVVGIILRFFAEPLVGVNRDVWLSIGVFSAILQAVGVVIYGANIALTRKASGEALTWQTSFVFASLGWWLLVAVAEPFYFALSHAAVKADGIFFVAEYFAPYREAQFLGFVSMMIFGVALTKMSSCFGAKPASEWAGRAGFLVWNLGLVARMIGWVSFYRAGLVPASQTLYTAGGIALAVGAALLVGATRLFEPIETTRASHKFVRAAMIWLLIAGVLMVCEPFHLAAIGEPFSHAFIGAIRHAVTVGFISQMILGVGLHLVSRHASIPDALQKALWPTFILLNAGNTGRVALEIATDYTASAYRPMGMTGFVELTGLALWGFYLASTMLKGVRPA